MRGRVSRRVQNLLQTRYCQITQETYNLPAECTYPGCGPVREMPILREIPIALNPEDVLRAQFMGRRRSFDAKLLRLAQEAVSLGAELYEPAAVYQDLPVQAIEDQELIVQGENGAQRLKIGPKIDLIYPAKRVFVAVVTIGRALEKRVRELQAGGSALEAYMLDTVGVVALAEVGDAVKTIIEGQAAEMGWGVSASLAPGSLVGWPHVDQRSLCALLALDSIGVQLSKSCVLEPHKSASTLVGIGPGFSASRIGSVCRFCSLADRCWRRGREDDGDCPGD